MLFLFGLVVSGGFPIRYPFPEIRDEVPENFKAIAGYADNTDGLWKIGAHETHGRREGRRAHA